MSREKLESTLDRSVTKFYEKLSAWEESVAQRVRLTPRQCHTISELGECGPIRMKPLSERLGVTTGTLTIMADRLEKLGLVQRREDASDKRAFLLSLSAKGVAVYREHIGHHEGICREFLTTLGHGEAETLIALLEKITSVL